MAKCPLLFAVRSLTVPNEFSVPSHHRRSFRRGLKRLADALVVAATERRVWLVNAELRQALEAVGKMAREIAASTAPSKPGAEAETHSTFRKLEADVRRLLKNGGGAPSKGAKRRRKRNAWVHDWRDLRNQSLKESESQLKSRLVRTGFMDDETEQPTRLAVKRLAARVAPDGCVEWHFVRWAHIAREQRRSENRGRVVASAAS